MKKTILITGASSGIGKSTAKFFHDKGWNVVATMRNPAAETELNTLDDVLVTRLDVEDAASIQSAVAAATERFGAIDVLLNNAGYGAYGVLEATPIEKVERQFRVNVIGLIATTQAVIPQLRKQGHGVIINISSIGGKMTFPLGTLYHGSKFAVEGLSEALSFEMAEIGVKVKLVEPGLIKTDFGGRSFDFSNDASMAEYQGIVQKLFAGLGGMSDNASEAEVVAEVIYTAATDGTDQLRYTAGADAAEIVKNRKLADDATFLAGLKEQLGL